MQLGETVMARKAAKTSVGPSAPAAGAKAHPVSKERAAIRWLLQQEAIRVDKPGHFGNQHECLLHLENLS